MAYNPQLYNPYGQPQSFSWSQPVQYQPQPTNGLVRVKGRQGAEAYPMGPNSVSPVLLDEDRDVFYIKRTDASGIGTVDEYDFTPRVQQQQQTAQSVEYATMAQLQALADKVDLLSESLMNEPEDEPEQEPAPQTAKRTRKAASNA